jgi:L-alanine-DL-glutamate epimerase-like enolase superfamily enzyme
MRIAAIHTARVRMPAHPDLVVHGSRGSHDRSDFLLVRVVTSDGTEGYGEVSATPIWSGEDGETAEHFVRDVLTPVLVGTALAPVGAAEALMDKALHGNPFTKAGVSIALWDAYAKTLGVPLAVALGGPYRTEIPIKLSLSGDAAHLERVYAAASAGGFGAFKVKVGLGVDGDVARFRRARALAGAETFLGADANGGWSRAEAMRAVRELDALGVAFVEQPLEPDDLAGAAALRGMGPPVVADESVFGMADLRRVIEAGAADVVSVYVGKAGGPGRAVRQAAVAATYGLEVVIGSNGELGLGAAAQLHVAAALPELSAIPSDIIGAHYYAEDVLAEPLDSDGRRVRLGDVPGLGVTLRDDLLKELR